MQFNRETLQPYKSHAYVKYDSTICMDRFLDDAPAEKKAQSKKIQQELNTLRERLGVLTRGQVRLVLPHLLPKLIALIL